MQALMLAAGMGRRMGKHTATIAKCMIEVGGRTLLERAVDALQEAGVQRFVMVVGWESEKLIDYIRSHIHGMEFEFIYNDDYAITNNIYSLYLAREKLLEDDTILLESDLIYDNALLKRIAECQDENLVAVAKYEHWMDGTVATINKEGVIQDFIEKGDFTYQNADQYYKTVNIYKFSKEFLRNQYLPFLEAYIRAYGKNQYYETVLKAIAHIANAKLKAYILEGIKWYEIDDAQDLDIAQTIFASEKTKLSTYERHFGGYWRFTGLKDFCYLVNPYFPPKKMLDQIKYFFDPLLRSYPSGMNIQKMLAEKLFHVDEDCLLVGNGAAELINTLGWAMNGKMALTLPSFNEYVRCFRNCEITPIYSQEDNFQLNKSKLIQCAEQGCDLAIINPDNPSGSFLSYADIIEILDSCRQNDVRCIVDESFIDFAAPQERYTLLENRLLERYPKLIVIKSISKSFGIPGIRLGILATADRDMLASLRALLPVWNINSFAEYYLQILGLYIKDYTNACDQIAVQREQLTENLKKIGYLEVYASSANYIMCKVKGGMRSKELATMLLERDDLLIKSLSAKDGFFGENYIRVAVKDQADNDYLYKAFKAVESIYHFE